MFILFTPYIYFNPRSRKGSDLNCSIKHTASINFNPRSRKGSDKSCIVFPSDSVNFNPRSRKGSDVWAYREDVYVIPFQSTLPQRERQTTGKVMGKIGIISIHAPAKGATVDKLGFIDRCVISIHAPAKGATFSIGAVCVSYMISIHAPAKGATMATAKPHLL